MILKHGLHLAYCTNVHPGEDWAQTFDSLNRHTLRVKQSVQPKGRYAIGLRLSDRASRELSDPKTLLEFQRWLGKNDCYVFTINGFPFGQFHGTRVKEKVYLPDWTDSKRLDYTTRLFDLLNQLAPAEMETSVSTLPGSFKDFVTTSEQARSIRDQVWRCVEHIARLSEKSGRRLHLGLEPEPFGLFENSEETIYFFNQLRGEHPNDPRLNEHLGVNYDTCHFAIEFEKPADAIAKFQRNDIRISKIHLSNALKLSPAPVALQSLAAFADGVYLHQVIIRHADGALTRFRDLDVALKSSSAQSPKPGEEWRVHFHVPLHCEPGESFGTTSEHVSGLLNILRAQPALCSHLEMETYTWAVMPEKLRSREVSDQIIAEYEWTLRQLRDCGLA
jgi:hypothetical protein